MIENRAAEFRRPEAPVLSPEQRLLIGDRAREQLGIDGAARRLAKDGEDSTSEDAQGLASVVLRKPPEEPKKPEPVPADAEAAAAIANAVINPQ